MTGNMVPENDIILSMLVAADTNYVIGKENRLPWHLPNDLKYFKNLTWGMPIVMGRKTFESIGKPLPGRKSIVITRNRDWSAGGTTVVHGVQEAIQAAQVYGVREIFVIGGAAIFQTAFAEAHRLYLTRIHHAFEGDVFLPSINEKEWQQVRSLHQLPDEKNRYAHTFEVWERKSKFEGENQK